jgi:hypothetical protein
MAYPSWYLVIKGVILILIGKWVMEDKELKIYDYTVIGMFLNPEGFFSVKVSLDKKDEHKIILKFANKLIEDLFKNLLSEEEIENKLNALLMENNKFLFIRLVRLALGSERIKTQLRANQTGIFILTSEKWQKIFKKLKEEKLEAILAEGLEDVVN